MADIAQVLVAGGTTIIGVAVGAGLTYWFNTLNRRHQEAREDRNRCHQEAREDRTRWYEARREAYASMLMAVSLYHRTWTAQADEGGELTEKGLNELAAAVHGVRLVGSPAAVGAANNLLSVIVDHSEGLMQELQEMKKSLEGRSDDDLTPEEKRALGERLAAFPLSIARAAFEDAARKDLGHLSGA